MTSKLYLGGDTDTVVHFEADGSVVVEERQDAQAILDHNARMRNERFHAGSGFAQEAFNIPMVNVIQWQKECGAPMLSDEHMAYMERQLRLPGNAYITAAPKLRDPRIIVKGAR